MKRSSRDEHDLLGELIGAERSHPVAPEAGETEACWKRIEHDLAVGAPAPFDLAPAAVGAAKGGWGLGALGKVVIVAALAGGGTATVVRTLDSSDPPTTVVSAEREAVSASGAPTAHSAAPRDPAPEVSEQAEEPSVVVGNDSEGLDEQPAVDTMPTAIGTSTPRRASATDRERPRGFQAELELLREAQAQLRRGAPTEALAILDRHAKKYPSGALQEDRAALRVIALCEAGRVTEGRASQARFEERYPRSLHLERVQAACPGPAMQRPKKGAE